jgi:protein Tex
MESVLKAYLKDFLPKISTESAQAVLDLVADGATVPFIARYRKDKTNNLDEVEVRSVIDAHEEFQELTKRKSFLIKEIGDQGNLSAELKSRIELSWDKHELEEIYRPFKKKKKTKAALAREAGLEKLAQWLWDVGHGTLNEDPSMEIKAKEYLNIPAGIISYEMALKAAMDINIEKLVYDNDLRTKVREHFLNSGHLTSERAKGFKPHSKFSMYAEFKESIKSLMEPKSSHRYLAMRRGEEEEELSLKIQVDDAYLLGLYQRAMTNLKDGNLAKLLREGAEAALKIHILPSIANEVHKLIKETADRDAIEVFAQNVNKILLAAPYGPKVVLGVDPGFKTGCKIALVDKSGKFLAHTVIQIMGDKAQENAKQLFQKTLSQMSIDAIAVGNGTAGRQAETFFRALVKDIGKEIPVVMVNESGASVYSASEVAQQEFPDLDLTVRGAISIARRLQDPLAELVKVDPKSIGVGQYQHDVNEAKLKKSLDAVVESCVNKVGVDLNTASEQLLAYVSGIGPQIAKNIIEFRKEKLFQERSDLLKISRFSSKAFEQCAGFLRIRGGKVFLDSTGIHPERYAAVKDMAAEVGVPVSELTGIGAKKLVEIRTKWMKLIGEHTFNDIINELEKPGRDPRDAFKVFQFRSDVFEVKDLKKDMTLPGIVTNVTNFGAFVDVGVHQDGLVHISEIADKFVDDPRKVVSPGDQVTVKVLEVDIDKNQISLTMRSGRPQPAAQSVARASYPKTAVKRDTADSKSAPNAIPNAGPKRDPRDQRVQRDQRDDRNHRDIRDNRSHKDGAHKGTQRTNEPPKQQQPRSGQKPFNNPFGNLGGINLKK